MRIEQILWGTIAAALVVMSGGAYAAMFALGRLRGSRLLLGTGYACYAALVLSSWMLASALTLEGRWQALVPLLLLGYLIAPHVIWKLCVATHAERRGSHAAGLSSDDYLEAPGFSTYDVFARYELTPRIRVRAGVFNIRDKTYYRWADVSRLPADYFALNLYTAPGRFLSLSFSIEL